jgi:sugar fermentation stimulation protein A
VKKGVPDIPLFSIPGAVSCRFVERLNRFVVKIEIEGKECLAHINNTGRLQEMLIPGKTGFCFRTPHTKKTEFRLFAIGEREKGALIDTQLQMRAFEMAQERGLIPWLRDALFVRRDAPLGRSQLDYLFQRQGNSLFVEVKSAVLREGTVAMYPDCPSLRGQRHVKELIEWTRKGGESYLLFMAALPGISAFTPNRNADAELHGLVEKAKKSGVGIKAVGLYFHPGDSFLRLYDPDLEVIVESQ